MVLFISHVISKRNRRYGDRPGEMTLRYKNRIRYAYSFPVLVCFEKVMKSAKKILPLFIERKMHNKTFRDKLVKIYSKLIYI